MIHNCEKEIRSTGPSSNTAQDGDRWECSCGLIYEHVCDEAEGCHWELAVLLERRRR